MEHIFMQKIMIDIIKDTLFDAIKLLPFLFLTYLLMEYLEHKTGDKTQNIVKKSGKLGPLFGGVLGIFPQCGFSAAAANLYAGRIITLGTLIAVFLSTSDEMLPILISKTAPVGLILKILALKLILGVIYGFIIDGVVGLRKKRKRELATEKFKKSSNEEKAKHEHSHKHNDHDDCHEEEPQEAIAHMCNHDHCDCEHEGIIKSSIKHTVNILLFIIVITFIINTLIYLIGEDVIANAIASAPIVGILVASLFGLIPNCAGSVIITELYLSNLISFGSMIAGLLVGSGIGILVLFKSNKNIKENLKITGTLYVIGVISGFIIDMIL